MKRNFLKLLVLFILLSINITAICLFGGKLNKISDENTLETYPKKLLQNY